MSDKPLPTTTEYTTLQSKFGTKPKLVDGIWYIFNLCYVHNFLLWLLAASWIICWCLSRHNFIQIWRVTSKAFSSQIHLKSCWNVNLKSCWNVNEPTFISAYLTKLIFLSNLQRWLQHGLDFPVPSVFIHGYSPIYPLIQPSLPTKKTPLEFCWHVNALIVSVLLD